VIVDGLQISMEFLFFVRLHQVTLIIKNLFECVGDSDDI